MKNKQQLIQEIVAEIQNQQQTERIREIGKVILSYLLAWEQENITDELMLIGIKKLATELSTIK